jgi:hypothetical protein
MKHNLLKTEQYLLVVDNSEIKEGDWFLSKENVVHNNFGWNFGDRKVIAHLPLNDAPDLKGVDLLPPLPTESDVMDKMLDSLFGEVNGSNIHIREVFMTGYKKAKENYKYTEEDMRKAIAFGVSVRDQGLHLDQFIYDKFFQQLKLPEIPVAFECVSRQPYYKVWAGNYIY